VRLGAREFAQHEAVQYVGRSGGGAERSGVAVPWLGWIASTMTPAASSRLPAQLAHAWALMYFPVQSFLRPAAAVGGFTWVKAERCP
jgi:hypothetical protein